MKKTANKFAIAAILALTSSMAMAQITLPSPTGPSPSDVSAPPSGVVAQDNSGDFKMAGLGLGLVGLVGVGKLAKRKKADKK